jgi:hypothetical protein
MSTCKSAPNFRQVDVYTWQVTWSRQPVSLLASCKHSFIINTTVYVMEDRGSNPGCDRCDNSRHHVLLSRWYRG